MNKLKLITSLGILSLVLAGCVHAQVEPNSTESTAAPAKSERTEKPQTTATEESNTIIYTDTGFSPKTLTVTLGATVTFINDSSRPMWVASSIHPTHEVLPEFDHKQTVAKGGSYSFTFDKAGEWKYHNHVSASDTGAIIVE